MPQGSPFGLLSFLLLIDDLTVDCLTHKYICGRYHLYRTPASRFTANSHAHIPSAVADLGHPKQNEDKLHEDQGDDPRPCCKISPQHLSDSSANNPVIVERVQRFKLLGITISHDMNWQTHIDAIITKASSRLYFLEILKKSRVLIHINSDTFIYRL